MALATNPTSPFEALLDEFEADGRLVHVEHLPPRVERHQHLSDPLPDAVATKLSDRCLWHHQAQAIDAIRRGENVVVATGTASGKSLCFQIPIAEAAADPIRPGTSLLLFPTKALAHDQLRSFAEFGFAGVEPGTYDGDATKDERAWIRSKANVILTNPEMLHGGLLPQHKKWEAFLMRLRYVVVDELHVLRGVFGTHVSHVLRRLRRLCDHYGTDPTFVFTSATVGQPERLASALCGAPVTAITEDGSPAGPRRFALVDPARGKPDTGGQPSRSNETATTSASLISSGYRTITFCRSRKTTELVTSDILRRMPDRLKHSVMAYRAGYLAEERRSIEAQMNNGDLSGLVATSALELGVDIGHLDACVINGFPGTIASMWQQAGRAGRRTDPSVTVMVAGEDQLDRYLMRHPDEVFARPPETATINTSNPFILSPHLAAAAYELPLSHDDTRWWNAEELHDAVRDLVRDDQLRIRKRWHHGREIPIAHWRGTGYPSRRVGLRSGASAEVKIVDHDTGRLVGTVDESQACTSVHPGAIYVHRGQMFEVTHLDLADRQARVVETEDTVYSQARSETTIGVLHVDERRRVGRSTLHLGEVEVATSVTGYQLRDSYSRRLIANETLDLPEQRLVTRAFWYSFDDEIIEALPHHVDLAGAMHAAEHAAIGMLPLFTICDRWDVGGVSTPHHQDTHSATIFIYDGYPGGAGIAELGWEAGARHLRATRESISSCSCLAGCPSCVQSPKCGSGNEPLDKTGAIELLQRTLASVK